MRVVVDTNIVFSALLNSGGVIAKVLLQPGSRLNFYSCTFLQQEIEGHRQKILGLTRLTDQQLTEALLLLYSSITFIPEEIIPKAHLRKADALAADVDGDDVLFIALSLYLRARVWTGDKKLINGLSKKGFSRFVSIDELMAQQGQHR